MKKSTTEISALNVRIPIEFHRKFKAFCALHGLQLKQVVIDSINKYMDNFENKSKNNS